MSQAAIPTFVANSILGIDAGVVSSFQAQLWKPRTQIELDLLEWGEVLPFASSDLLESGEVLLLVSSKHENIEREFNRLLGEWKSGRNATSSSTAIATHPAYQRIIGLGKPALPLILRELGRELDHWFWALKAISGEDPVPLEHVGKMRQMAADWLRWGRRKGYVR